MFKRLNTYKYKYKYNTHTGLLMSIVKRTVIRLKKKKEIYGFKRRGKNYIPSGASLSALPDISLSPTSHT